MVKRDVFSLYFVVSIFLLIFDYFGLLNRIKAPFDIIIKPIKQTVYQTSIVASSLGNIITQYPKFVQIASDLESLKHTNEELVLKVRTLTEENIKLRTQLGSQLPSSYQFIVAPVLGVSRYMELGAGESQGVKAGMTVVDGTIFIGKIVTLGKERSNVLLLNDSDASVPVRSSRGTKGIVTGQFGKTILMTKILQKDLLFLEDQITTSGEENYPPNLLIGKISHITLDDTASYKQAKIDYPLDWEKERTVFVISSL